MSHKRFYMTANGLVKLEAELQHLYNVERPEIILRLQDATIGSEWTDNTEHMLVEEELAFVDARIQELEMLLANAEPIPGNHDGQTVSVGDTVVIEVDGGEPETYTIVGVAEADPSAGLISNESPLAQAILERRVGEEVTVRAPAGDYYIRIVAIQ